MNRTKVTVIIATLVLALSCVGLVSAKPGASGYELFGNAALVSPGHNSPTGVKLESAGTYPAPTAFGGVDFAVPSGLTVADLDYLGTDYNGPCGGGSPRFQVNVIDPNDNQVKNIFVYLEPCSAGWNNTGNLLDPTDNVDASQIGGAFYMPYATVQSLYGSYQVVGIQLVVDGSWFFGGPQDVLFDNVMVNTNLYTFESADTCKKNGWMAYTGAPGPFKNQGQCVSYFAKGGQ